MKVLVTGAAGFIGHHLCRRLKAAGHHVTGVDIVEPQYGYQDFDAFYRADLRDAAMMAQLLWEIEQAGQRVDELYALAADMGGMGYIATHDAEVVTSNLLITTHTIHAARQYGVGRLLYTSSACVYPEYRQMEADNQGLRETDAYPAMPDTGYGWEKLMGERLCTYYRQDLGFETRIARLHNVYGPEGTWDGGREKAPAALCRKVAEAKRDNRSLIDVWGDGQQTRSFCYVDDCIEGLIRLMRSDYAGPLNIGSDHLVSINGLARSVAYVAAHDIEIAHVAGPQGVRGRCSDNTLCRRVLDWAPETMLEDGLRRQYAWVEQQVLAREAVTA